MHFMHLVVIFEWNFCQTPCSFSVSVKFSPQNVFICFTESKCKMKEFFLLITLVAVTVAFPYGEPEHDPQMLNEMKKEEQNTLLAVEGNPRGDNLGESEAERGKRHILVGYPWPIAYSYPIHVHGHAHVLRRAHYVLI